MISPVYDKRKSEDLQEEIKKIIPAYLPVWKPEEKEVGWTVARLFTSMQEDVIDRLNYIPENLFIHFLENLNIFPEHANPSKGFIVFKPSENLQDPVNIKKGVKLSTEGRIKFETEEDLTVNSIKIKKIISVNPEIDSILFHSSSEKPLFSSSPQAHYLYAGDDSSFYFLRENGSKLYVEITPPVNRKWEYFYGYDEEGKEIWKIFVQKGFRKYSIKILPNHPNYLYIKPAKIPLYKKDPAPVQKKSINGIEAFWLRTKLSKNNKVLPTKSFKIKGKSGISTLYFNDTPLDPLFSKPVKPFGEQPKTGDLFYIASDEAFSKKNAKVDIYINFETGSDNKFVAQQDKFSYEYWNGSSWKFLKKELRSTDEGIKISFTVPEDICSVEINGETHFFIRIRLLDFIYMNLKQLKNNVIPEYTPPQIKKIDIYFSIKTRPKYLFTYNNMEFKEYKGILYKPLEDKTKTLYLGFEGNVSDSITFFFSLKCTEWNPERFITWKFWNGDRWAELQVKDGTENFRKSGILKLLFPSKPKSVEIFGEKLKWIKGEFQHTGDEKIYVQAVYPNAVKIKQVESFYNEIIGSSNGSPNQIFRTKNRNIQDIRIYVKEPVRPNEEEYYEENGFYWVLWKEIDDLYKAKSQQRVYSVDRSSGEIKFGNGINGKIPPAGKNNIKADYTAGGGINGNVDSFQIKNLVSSIPYIEEVFNPEKTYGGSDTETVIQAFERFPTCIRHRNRAVNDIDYENIVKRKFQNIAKLKILKESPGILSVIVYDDTEGERKEVDTGFLHDIKDFLVSYMPATVDLNIKQPEFGLIDIDVAAVTTDISLLNRVKQNIEDALRKFLNPVKGGKEGKGWEFGTLPFYSDFFPVLTEIENVVYIKSLKIFLSLRNKKLQITTSSVEFEGLPPDLLIMPASINVKVSVEEK
ncbi:baseplate J/gp47 family protein [Persephonella sp.]